MYFVYYEEQVTIMEKQLFIRAQMWKNLTNLFSLGTISTLTKYIYNIQFGQALGKYEITFWNKYMCCKTHFVLFVLKTNTVGINPILLLSDLNTPRTLRLGWRYFEAHKNDRNERQIHKNSQKGTGTKMAEKLINFEKFEKKIRSNFSPVLNPETLWWLARCPKTNSC